jgi:hypothetical protein
MPSFLARYGAARFPNFLSFHLRAAQGQKNLLITHCSFIKNY